MDPFNAKEAVTLVTHDTNLLARRPTRVLVAAAGNAVVRAQGSSADITLTGLAAGQVLPLSVIAIRATGTTATLVGLW
jgi:hypothetical protein